MATSNAVFRDAIVDGADAVHHAGAVSLLLRYWDVRVT
jgi:hypothetical protein